MTTLNEFLESIENPQQKTRMTELLDWVSNHFTSLELKVAWNQPMFTNNGTFIIGFSISKQHISVSPEQTGMIHFKTDIEKSGYSQSKMLFRIKWNEEIDYLLLEKIIQFNCYDKRDCKTFWRK